MGMMTAAGVERADFVWAQWPLWSLYYVSEHRTEYGGGGGGACDERIKQQGELVDGLPQQHRAIKDKCVLILLEAVTYPLPPRLLKNGNANSWWR